MRRLLIFLSFIFALFILVGCDKPTVPTEPTEPTATGTLPTEPTEPTPTPTPTGTEPVVEATYFVVFDSNLPGAPFVTPQTVEAGAKATEPPAPSVENYEFLGWTLDNQDYNFQAAVNSNLILKGKWVAKKSHNVYYENVNALDFGYGEKQALVDAFMVDFYDFINPEGLTLQMFTHAVDGDYNGFWKNYADDKKLYDGSIPDLLKLDNKTFLTSEKYGPKWYPFFEFLNDWIIGINSTQFFWKAGSAATSTGVIRLQQFLRGTKPAASLPDEYMLQLPKGEVLYRPVDKFVEGQGVATLPVPYRSTHAFEGWFDNSDLVGAPVTSISTTAKGNVTLYAKWRQLEQYEVIFTLNYEGAKVIEPIELLEGNLVARPASPARPLHIFDGWHLDPAGTVAYDFTAPVLEDTVIYAKWLDAVFVTFDYNTDDVDDVVVKMVKDTLVAEPATPTKEGFKFDGWYVDLDDEDPFDFEEELDDDITLVAKWVLLEEFTITYELNDGEFMPEFADRDAMVVAFLTDYYNFISDHPDVYDTSKNTLEEFIGDTGLPNDISVPTNPKYKYDGNFNTAMSLLTQQDMSVDLNSRYFVAQLEYNMWRPLIEAMETFTHVGNPDQHIWGVAEFRVKPFIGMLDLWRYHDAPTTKIIKDAMELIPQQYQTPITKYNEQSAFPLPFPIMDSAEFLGWYDNEDLEGEAIFAIEPGREGDLDLYAKWNKLDIVKAKYHFYDGIVSTSIIEKGKILDEPVDPVRDLHEFLGWYDNEEYTGEPFDFDTEPEEDIDLYAKWNKLPSVVVTFDPANDEDEFEFEILKDTPIEEPKEPAKEGYRFLGWYDGETLHDFDADVTANLDLVGKWELSPSIVYHYDGGNYGIQNMINNLNPVHVIAPRYAAGADPTGESYSISTTKSTWWYALAFKETELPEVYELIGKQGANVDADFDTSEVVFYVQYHDGLKGNFVSQIKKVYEDIEVGDLLVIPNLPEEMVSNNLQQIDLYYIYDFSIRDQYPIRLDKISELLVPVKEGHEFVGWFAEDTYDTQVTELPASLTENKDLYAKWKELDEFTITFDLNYDGSVDIELSQYDGFPLEQPENPLRAGYLFTYWHIDGKIYNFNTPITEDITLVAGWYELDGFEVTFDVDDVKTVVDVEEYAKVAVPANPAKEGKIFDAWYLGEEPFDFNTPITEDITLVAKWLDSVYVTYELYDGLTFVVELVKGERIAKPAEPVRLDHLFLGWFVNEEAFDFDQPINSNITLVADWLEAPVYQINYHLDDGDLKKGVVVEAFLKDFYAFVNPEESLDEFMHGEGNVVGYDGTWHSEHKALIYAGPRPDAVDNDYFISHQNYMDKWLPFFDTIEEFVQIVNSSQHFYDDTFVGFIRIRQYIINAKPIPSLSDATMAMIPEEFEPITEYNLFTEAFNFIIPVKPRHEFLGWYENAAFTGDPITKLDPEADKELDLYAKWSKPYYQIAYDLDGGEFLLNTKEKMIEAFLKDFYAFVNPDETLEVFMHGEDNVDGYDGTWHSEHKALIYAGPRPEAVDNDYFISHEDYMDEWLPFFDTVEAFIRAVNPDQFFYGTSTSVGLIRIRQYVADIKPAAWVADSLMAMMPEAYIEAKRYNADTDAFDFFVPEKDGFDFLGWYDNDEFTGAPLVTLDPMGEVDLVLYAKWVAK